MDISLNLKLCYSISETPRPYWIEVEGNYDSSIVQYKDDGFQEFIPELDDDGNLNLQLLVSETTAEEFSNPVRHSVELGALLNETGIDVGTSLNVSVLANGEKRGSGQVKIASAEQTSRPIPGELV